MESHQGNIEPSGLCRTKPYCPNQPYHWHLKSCQTLWASVHCPKLAVASPWSQDPGPEFIFQDKSMLFSLLPPPPSGHSRMASALVPAGWKHGCDTAHNSGQPHLGTAEDASSVSYTTLTQHTLFQNSASTGPSWTTGPRLLPH